MDSKRRIVETTSEIDEVPFSSELVVDADRSFHRILLEAIDDAGSCCKQKNANSQKEVSKNDLQRL